MNKHFPKKAKDIKGAVAIAELRRAHYIVTLLAVTLAVTIGCVSAFELRFDPLLAAIVIVLLSFVAVVSLGTAIVLGKR